MRSCPVINGALGCKGVMAHQVSCGKMPRPRNAGVCAGVLRVDSFGVICILLVWGRGDEVGRQDRSRKGEEKSVFASGSVSYPVDIRLLCYGSYLRG